MFKCECGKEYKSEKGFNAHVAKCDSHVPADNGMFATIERHVRQSGRPVIVKPGMEKLVENWAQFKVGSTILLPDASGSKIHADVTLERYHFKKVASKSDLHPGQDYTIENHPDHGAVITRLR